MTFTDRQDAAWFADAVPILERHGIVTDLRTHYWSIKWADPIRPHRGSHFNATYCDGEHFAQVLMDVYGFPQVSVAELDWVHADSDEELTCDDCDGEVAA